MRHILLTRTTCPNSDFSSSEIFSGLSKSVVRKRRTNSITVSSVWLSKLIVDAQEGTELIDSDRTHMPVVVVVSQLMLDGMHRSYSLVDNVLMAQLIFLCWPLNPSTVSSLGAVISIFRCGDAAAVVAPPPAPPPTSPFSSLITCPDFMFVVASEAFVVDRLESVVEGDTTLAGVVLFCRSIRENPSVISGTNGSPNESRCADYFLLHINSLVKMFGCRNLPDLISSCALRSFNLRDSISIRMSSASVSVSGALEKLPCLPIGIFCGR